MGKNEAGHSGARIIERKGSKMEVHRSRIVEQ